MGLRSLAHVTGVCVAVLLGSSVANAALLSGAPESGTFSLEWSTARSTPHIWLGGGTRPVRPGIWATSPDTPNMRTGAEQQAALLTWTAIPDGTAFGMHLGLPGWEITPNSTSGLHLPLVISHEVAPVPLPATVWLFGSGALAALLASLRRPDVCPFRLGRSS